MSSTSFAARHIGPRAHEVKHMLNTVGVSSLEQLIDETVPAGIRNQSPLAIGEGLAEHAFLNLMREKAAKNKVNKSYLGLGYHPTLVPTVILRNILENPGWYTAYTP